MICRWHNYTSLNTAEKDKYYFYFMFINMFLCKGKAEAATIEVFTAIIYLSK